MKMVVYQPNSLNSEPLREETVPLGTWGVIKEAPRMQIPEKGLIADSWHYYNRPVMTFPHTFSPGETIYGKTRQVSPIWLIDHTGTAIKYYDDNLNEQTAVQLDKNETMTVCDLRSRSERLQSAIGCVFVKSKTDISMVDPNQGVLWGDNMDNLVLGEVRENTYLMFLFPDDVTISFYGFDPVQKKTQKLGCYQAPVYSVIDEGNATLQSAEQQLLGNATGVGVVWRHGLQMKKITLPYTINTQAKTFSLVGAVKQIPPPDPTKSSIGGEANVTTKAEPTPEEYFNTTNVTGGVRVNGLKAKDGEGNPITVSSLIIPDEIGGKPVVSIYSSAFKGR